MQKFIGEDFVLNNETGKKLYHQYASKMPIVDYHCHISPKEIYEDKRFADITEVWLGGDHYKWRVMRTMGVSEEYITGSASSHDKFMEFARVLPYAVGNPVYIWAHLELKRYFNCDLTINEQNAEAIWNHCNDKLQNDSEFSARNIIKNSNVTALATTDDPIDSLEWHEKLAQDSSFKTKVLPAFRPDKAIVISAPIFVEYTKKLSEVSGVDITDFDSMCKALSLRVEYFNKFGCRASDHGIQGVHYCPATNQELNEIASARLSGKEITQEQALKYEYNVLVHLAKEYHKHGWVFEIHYGANRNVNSDMFGKLGPDTGYDAIRPQSGGDGLGQLLDEVNQANALPKTILFSLNPNDDMMLNVLVGSFQKQGTKGHVQNGSAWWFNDTRAGMEKQITSYATASALDGFVGMLTDSRSFLSYTRHEYFRRILCNLIGNWVERGEYPDDIETLGKIVQNVSYNNAVEFFGF